MSTSIAYQGKHLGNIRYDSLRKSDFVANSLEELETLLGLKPTDIIDVEEDPMQYSEFRKKYLDNVDAFYPTLEAWATRLTFGSTKQILRSQ